MDYANNEKIKQKQLTNNKLELLIPTKKIKKNQIDFAFCPIQEKNKLM